MFLKSVEKAARLALGRPSFVADEEAAYRRLAVIGFKPAGIVDVGAYEGNWTRLTRRVFPDVPVLIVEAQEAKRPHLDAVTAELPGATYVSAVLGATAGEAVTFYEMETGSSLLPENSNAVRQERRMTTRTLDEVADGVPGSLFLKLDVQGAELKVLAGGEETLRRADVVQLEVAMLGYNAGAPTFVGNG